MNIQLSLNVLKQAARHTPLLDIRTARMLKQHQLLQQRSRAMRVKHSRQIRRWRWMKRRVWPSSGRHDVVKHGRRCAEPRRGDADNPAVKGQGSTSEQRPQFTSQAEPANVSDLLGSAASRTSFNPLTRIYNSICGVF